MATVESSVSSSSAVSAEVFTYALFKLGKSKLILKEEQKLAIFSLISGRDVFVWLPMDASIYVQQSADWLGTIINKTLGRAQDLRANGAWLSKLTE